MIQTYPEMNEIIVDLIRDSDHLHVQYAAARIEELENGLAYCNAECETAMKYAVTAERQLAECVAAIRRWSETLPDTKEDFFAALCALDIAERSIESAAPEAAGRIEKLAQQLEVERQERQNVEWERDALRERIVRHISDQLDYWKQEARR